MLLAVFLIYKLVPRKIDMCSFFREVHEGKWPLIWKIQLLLWVLRIPLFLFDFSIMHLALSNIIVSYLLLLESRILSRGFCFIPPSTRIVLAPASSPYMCVKKIERILVENIVSRGKSVFSQACRRLLLWMNEVEK